MPSRPTIADLAREAGFGVATVDRALNGRPNVSERAVARIAEAAERIGYYGKGLAKYRAEAVARPKVRLGFVLQKPRQEFYTSFAALIKRTVEARTDVQGTAVIRHPETQSVDERIKAIREAADHSDALALVVPNHPTIEGVIRELSASGLPVFTLLNDLSQSGRQAYFGTDNMKVGRIAAWMLTTYLRQPGELAIFVGSGRWYGHMMREVGFQSFLRQNAPEFRLLDTMISLDTRQVAYEATLDLLDRRPNVRGIYVAGGGMEGTIAALREARPPGKIGLVVNELTDESRAALADRYALMAISTPIEEICQRCVTAMIGARSGMGTSGQIFLAPSLHISESI